MFYLQFLDNLMTTQFVIGFEQIEHYIKKITKNGLIQLFNS